MSTELKEYDIRHFALIALLVLIISEMIDIPVSYLMHGQPYINRVLAISLKTVAIWWVLPLIITYKVEKKDFRALGVAILRKRYFPYTLYIIILLILPAFLVGHYLDLLLEFIEQAVYIGLAEEYFYRGYLMNRLCGWLGDWKGLLVGSFIFGLTHFSSRIVQEGLGYIYPAAIVATPTFFGGLVLGYIFLRTRNIWPSAIIHISGNMYIYRVIELLGYS